MGPAFWEWIGDHLFTVVGTVGSLAVIVYLWAQFGSRNKGRYKS
ncbi:EYxxD motif small membrane protein [Ammoniphilus resinae]|uniref:Uncharacterized protein n=1 Tax=Ammoniphilus resinae TaxID=861532 RepID=A0ABS4GIM4_9BACL|nr:EYxxD motif small membrane protein [Ammoniphilus resinae]MBP1930079.1 hypothetical protein [Ammoniphilus resinae]